MSFDFLNKNKKNKETETQKRIEEAKKQLSEVEKNIQSKQQELHSLQQDVIAKKDKILELNKELNQLEGVIEVRDMGIDYIPVSHSSSEAERKINKIQQKLGTMLAQDKIMIVTKKYLFSGSEAKGKQFQKNYCENLLIGFNTYFERKKKLVSEKNYERTVELIKKSFDKFNKKSSILGFSINSDYLSLCLELLQAELDKKIAIAAEKAAIKEEQRKIREEQRLIEEAEREKKRMEELKKAMNISLSSDLTEEERNKIEQEISKIDKRIDDLNYRINNPKAGWLYVTESASMPGIKKIGVSRRENVYLRLAELSSSSVYYPFKMNVYCFSDDVFELERQMHKYFDEFRVAPNREFFRIATEDAVKALTEVFHQEIHFPKIQQEEDDTNALNTLNTEN